MNEKFVFNGQTTFVNQPISTIISNFQNTFVDENQDRQVLFIELQKMIEVILRSVDAPAEEKEEMVEAAHEVARQISSGSGNRLTWRGMLDAIKDVATKVADIAVPVAQAVAAIKGML